MHRAWNLTLAFALAGTLAATMSPRRGTRRGRQEDHPHLEGQVRFLPR